MTLIAKFIRAYHLWRAVSLLNRTNFHLQAADPDHYADCCAPCVLALHDAIRAAPETPRCEAGGLMSRMFKPPGGLVPKV